MNPLHISFIALISLAGALFAAPVPNAADPEDALPVGAAARFGTVRFRHGGPITTIAVSADGKFIASAGRDRLIRIWDADNGKLLRSIRCDVPSPAGVAFSPDGKQLLTNIDSESIHIFDWSEKQPPRSIKTAVPQSVVWSKDGKHIGCDVGEEDSLGIHDAASGKLVRTFKKASRIAFAGDGKTAAVAFLDGEINLISIDDGAVIKSLLPKQAGGNITELRYTSDDGLLIAAHTGGTIAVWEPKTGAIQKTFQVSGSLALVPGKSSAIAADKGQLVMLDFKSGGRKALAINASDDTPLAFLPDGNRLVVGGPNNRLHIWNLTTGKELFFADGHEKEVTALYFAPDGKGLISAGGDGMRLWDLQAKRERAGARRLVPVSSFLVSPDSKRLLSADDKAISIWTPVDFAKEQPYSERPSLTIPINVQRPPALAYSPDGNRIVFTDVDKKVVFADPMRGTTFAGLTMSADPLAVAFSPNGRYLSIHTRDGWLRQWMVGLRDGREGKDIELWSKRVQRGNRGAVAYSPNGLLVAVFSGGRVVLLDSINGRQWYGFEREFGEGDVQAIAFSPDGRFVAASYGAPHGFVRVWEVLTAKIHATFQGHAGGINAIAYSPDGKQIASAGSDTTVLLWNVPEPSGPDLAPLSLEDSWDGLDSQDFKMAYRATESLMRHGRKSLTTIEEGAKKAVENRARIGKWIQQLDDDDFRKRKVAHNALDKEGLRALPQLYDSLKTKLSVDMERQIRLLIEGMEMREVRIPESGLFGEPLRSLRSILVLERIGGPDAIRVLEKLAETKDESRIAAEARSALSRARP